MFDKQFLSGWPLRKVGFKGWIQAEHVALQDQACFYIFLSFSENNALVLMIKFRHIGDHRAIGDLYLLGWLEGTVGSQ